MMSAQAFQHFYEKLADDYDFCYGPLTNHWGNAILKVLDLQPDSKVADVGAGSGLISQYIYKKIGLLNPVLAVEPCCKLLDIAVQKDGVTAMLCTAYKYFTSNVALEYENVIMSGVVHHFDNMLETFQMMYKIPKVHCVVIGYGNMPTLLWEDVRKKWVMPWEMIEQNLVQAGFKVKRTDEHYTLRINKMQWYDTIRKRIYSTLNDYTDEEIEAGIKELEDTRFKDFETLETQDTLTVLSAINE